MNNPNNSNPEVTCPDCGGIGGGYRRDGSNGYEHCPSCKGTGAVSNPSTEFTFCAECGKNFPEGTHDSSKCNPEGAALPVVGTIFMRAEFCESEISNAGRWLPIGDHPFVTLAAAEAERQRTIQICSDAQDVAIDWLSEQYETEIASLRAELEQCKVHPSIQATKQAIVELAQTELGKENARLLAELEQARKKAARYDYLTTCWLTVEHPVDGPILETGNRADEYKVDKMDQAIDNAIRALGEGKE